MRLVGLITVRALPQVLFDCLAGNWIQFAIQITIHQFYGFLTVHLFLLTEASRQIFPELAARAGEPRHDRAGRNLRDVGYLLIGESFLVSQYQDLAEFR